MPEPEETIAAQRTHAGYYADWLYRRQAMVTERRQIDEEDPSGEAVEQIGRRLRRQLRRPHRPAP